MSDLTFDHKHYGAERHLTGITAGVKPYILTAPDFFAVRGSVDVEADTVLDLTMQHYPVPTYLEYTVRILTNVPSAILIFNGINFGTDRIIHNLRNGYYPFTLTALGYQPYNGFVRVSGGDVRIGALMIANPAGVSYTATFNCNIPTAEMTFNGVNYGTQRTVSGLVNGVYPYSFTANGYDTVEDTVRVRDGNVATVVNMIQSKYSVHFNIIPNDAKLVFAGVDVGQSRDIGGLVNGTYSYIVSRAGYNSVSDNVTINNGNETVNIDMVVTNYSVTFNITPANANLVFNGQNYGQGSRTIAGLANGVYAWQVTAPFYQTQGGTVTINGANKIVNVNLTTITYAVRMHTQGLQHYNGLEIAITFDGVIYYGTFGQTYTLPSKPNGAYAWNVSFIYDENIHSQNGTATVNNVAVDIYVQFYN